MGKTFNGFFFVDVGNFFKAVFHLQISLADIFRILNKQTRCSSMRYVSQTARWLG